MRTSCLFFYTPCGPITTHLGIRIDFSLVDRIRSLALVRINLKESFPLNRRRE